MKIFISYSHLDSNSVVPIAEELVKLYGKNSILIDCFNVKPGDSIIDFMNQSLETFTHFIFFISRNSIKSYMVSLEWKNALILCKDKTRKFIPVIVDSVAVPAILGDIRYINLYSVGLLHAFQEIKDVLDNKTTTNKNSDNLEASISKGNNKVHVCIKTNYYTEPNSSFCIVFNNLNLNIKPTDHEPFCGSTDKILIDGKERLAFYIRIPRVLTVHSPFSITFESNDDLQIYTIMHVEEENGNLKGTPIKIFIDNL